MYASVGCIGAHITEKLLNEFALFKDFLKDYVTRYYDDDLKLFLVEALRKIDYLNQQTDEVLT